MSKVQTLRAFVDQRLTAAAEEILELFERTVAEYEEELCRQRKAVEDVMKPEVLFHRADMADVVTLITTVLPNCQGQPLLDTLESIGVSSLEDLGFVEPDDLEGVLKKVESRKLLARAKALLSPAERNYSGHESFLSSPAGFSSSQATLQLQPCVKALSGNSGAGFEDGTLPNSPESSQSAPRISTSTNADINVDNLTASTSNSDTLLSTLDHDWHFNFCIPWNSMPSHIKETLEKQERPSAKNRREVVRMVTAEILAVCKCPQKKHLREIARKMVLAYPKSFKDVIGGQVVGSGYDSLTKQLQCRVDNCRRAQPGMVTPASTGRRRRRQKNVYRCVNPDPLPGNLEVEQQNKEELQRMFENDDMDENKIEMLMTETFASQRRDVLSGNDMQTLKEEWPHLFDTTGLKTHFKQLTGVHIDEEFKETMSRKSKRILQCLKIRDRGSGAAKLRCEIQSANTSEELYHAVRMLLLHFKEDESRIFVQVEDACISAEVRRDDLPPNPCIVLCGDGPLTTGAFMVAVDQVVVMERISTFPDAMASMFMMYYVMNIDYPAEVCATLEFLQRCIFRINPDNGSRVGNQEKRKRLAVNPKVLSLISNFSEND